MNQSNNLRIQIGNCDDIGNARVQQDASFIIQKLDQGCTIFGVADGHGQELGHIASNACVKSVTEFVDANLDKMVADTVLFLEECFAHAQAAIARTFIDYYVDRGYEVNEEENGRITKRRFPTHSFTNASGGTMLTIAVLKGGQLFIANVGDCNAQLCSETPVMTQDMLRYEKDVSVVSQETHQVVDTVADTVANAAANAADTAAHMFEDDEVSEVEDAIEDTVKETPVTDSLVLTSDHSPMNPKEYVRMRKFRPSEEDPLKAEMLFVYDEQETPKPFCQPVFTIGEDGVPTVRDDVPYYYKNVCKERAAYVSVPANAYLPDALASTRSMGDFNIATYGVSAKPEIQSIDLNRVLEHTGAVCVTMCSDGVWDNWLPEHVTKFMMDASCLGAVKTDVEKGAQRVAKSFMKRNEMFAQKNFRGNADNAMCVVVYVSKVPVESVVVKEKIE
jgi:serine/threonine protein phosphatase PrpC